MLDVPENLCVPLLTLTPPNAAAADILLTPILLTPSPPKKIDRRAAAAGQNHPARRRRNTDVGAGLYLHYMEKNECEPHRLISPYEATTDDYNGL